MRTSSRARRTTRSRSIFFSTLSRARRKRALASVSTSGSFNSNPPAAAHQHWSACIALRPVCLQAPFDGVQELECGAAVEDAVVEGDLEVHHAAYGDGVVYHDGTLDDGFRGEYRRLRVIDNGRRDHTTEGARVVDGEGAARDVFGAELAGAGAPHQVVDPAGEPDEVQLVGVGDDGHDEGVFEVDGYADVYALSEDNAVFVPDRVEDGMLPEALDYRPYYERQVS